MENCIFCKIAKGEIDSAKIWEDKDFLAILDAFPNTKGMTLVMPKKHFDSYAFSIPDDIYSKLMLASRKVAKILEKSLGVERVSMVAEGMGVNHAHTKLYPMRGLDEESKKNWVKDEVFFEKYPGYVNTSFGPPADIEDLKKLAEEIQSRSN